jgi:predicted dehydrogenase
VHAEQALAALDRGVHLLLKKPITDEVASARTLAERARDADVVTATGFLLRYDTAYARACRTAREGALGDVVGARVKRTITVSEIDRLGERPHPLFYTSIHDIDLLNYALDGRVMTVSAVERRGSHDVDVPDAFQALLTFECGTIVTVEGYSVLPADAPETPDAAFELTGTEGYATVESPSNDLTVHTERYDYPDTRHWPVIGGRVRGAVRAQMTTLADAVAGRDEMAATIEDGYRAQVVAQTTEDAIAIDASGSVDVDDTL